jgi:hypothetical protein
MDAEKPYNPVVITRRLKRTLIALLLPLLVLRAMLPAGYMPVADASGLRIVMCSEGLAPPAASTADAGTTRHELPPNAGQCPFAHSGDSAPALAAATADFTPAFWVHAVSITTASPAIGQAPRHAHQVRGPPVFS